MDSLCKDEQKNKFGHAALSQQLQYHCKVNDQLFYLTNERLYLKERDTGAHCPILATIELSDVSKQEKKKTFQSEDKKERADKRKAEHKARKAKGKAKART